MRPLALLRPMEKRFLSPMAFSHSDALDAAVLPVDVVGAPGLLRKGSPGAILHGRLEREHRRCQINSFGGGASEVLRDMVAYLGLGLPRSAG